MSKALENMVYVSGLLHILTMIYAGLVGYDYRTFEGVVFYLLASTWILLFVSMTLYFLFREKYR